jgi:hypothetical protein
MFSGLGQTEHIAVGVVDLEGARRTVVKMECAVRWVKLSSSALQQP